MASIQLFPRTHSRRAVNEAWRSVPLPGTGALRVREARLGDYAAIRALQKGAAGATPPCTLRQFERRLHVFGPGQLVAVCEGQVIAYASALLVDWDSHAAARTWDAITGEGTFSTHAPRARSLYGAELSVDVSQRGFAAARLLMQARRRLARSLNVKRLVMTPSLLGYESWSSRIAPEEYAMRIVWGDAPVAEWRFLMAQGFQFCGVLRDFHGAEASCLHAGLLAWLNPLFAPPRPPANEESESPRKCA